MSVIEPSWEFRLSIRDLSRPSEPDTVLTGQLRGYNVDVGRLLLELVTPTRARYEPLAVPAVAAALDTDDGLGPVIPPEPANPTNSYRLAGVPPWGQVVVSDRYLTETRDAEASATDTWESRQYRARYDAPDAPLASVAAYRERYRQVRADPDSRRADPFDEYLETTGGAA